MIAIAVVITQFSMTLLLEDSIDVVDSTASEAEVIERSVASLGDIAAVSETRSVVTNSVSSFWNAVSPADDSFAPVLSLKLEQHRLIAFDREALMAIKEQDKVELYVPHVKKHHEVWIERVARLKSGNLSITGSVDGQPDFPFVLTLGENSVYAAFGTEDGVYNVRGNQTHAWMIPTIALRKLRDFKKPDFRTPDFRKRDDENKSNS